MPDVMQMALDKFGVDAQVDKTIEEMAELTKALLKYRLNPSPDNRVKVIEELVDIDIMLEQVQKVFVNCDLEGITGYNKLYHDKYVHLYELVEDEQ